MKNLLVQLSIISIFILSCKKKDSSTPIVSSPSPVAPILENENYGSLQVIHIVNYIGNTFSGNDSTVIANFYANVFGTVSNPTINAGIVTLNGKNLKNIINNYIDTTKLINVHQTNSSWSVSGNSLVPAINYTFSPAYPIFTGNASLPDSFSVSSGVSINIVGAGTSTNQFITVEITDGVNLAIKSIQRPATSCTFSAAELSTLSIGSLARVIVFISNSGIQPFGTKKYNFINELQHNKYNVKIKA